MHFQNHRIILSQNIPVARRKTTRDGLETCQYAKDELHHRCKIMLPPPFFIEHQHKVEGEDGNVEQRQLKEKEEKELSICSMFVMMLLVHPS